MSTAVKTEENPQKNSYNKLMKRKKEKNLYMYLQLDGMKFKRLSPP